MMLEITLFSPPQAPETDLTECYELAKSVYAADYPNLPFVTYAVYKDQLLKQISPSGPQKVWTARRDGRIVGVATVTFPEHENQELTITMVRVPVALRRQGIGTSLLRATLPQVRAAGRTLVTGQGLKGGGDGAKWAAALGFDTVQQFVLQSLVTADVDPATWNVPAPAGFRTEQWIGAAPERLVAAYALARTAKTDAPTGQSSLEFPEWTVERVRAHEADVQRRGSESRVVVAVDESTGAIAGLTEIQLRPSQPALAYQQDTAVLPKYRGRGLGRFVKAAMMRWLMEERPTVERILTNTDATNVHMIRINHEIGYVTDSVMADVEAEVRKLAVES